MKSTLWTIAATFTAFTALFGFVLLFETTPSRKDSRVYRKKLIREMKTI